MPHLCRAAVCLVAVMLCLPPVNAAAEGEKASPVEQAAPSEAPAPLPFQQQLERDLRAAVADGRINDAAAIAQEQWQLYIFDRSDHRDGFAQLRMMTTRLLRLQQQAGAKDDGAAKLWAPLAVAQPDSFDGELTAEPPDAAQLAALVKRLMREHAGSVATAAAVYMGLAKHPYEFKGQQREQEANDLARQGLHPTGVAWLRYRAASWMYSIDGDPAGAQRLFEQVAAETKHAFLRQHALVRAAGSASLRKDGPHTETVRSLYARAIDIDPASEQANVARCGLADTYLAENKPDEALKLITDMRDAAPPGVWFGDPLVKIAQHQVLNGNARAGMELMRQITEAYPRSAGAALAWVFIAQDHGAAGRNELMVEAYKRAAALEPIDTHRSVMDASNTRNIAHESLAEHYMSIGDFRSALEWWRRWRPSSWCANCQSSMNLLRQNSIIECQMKTGLFAEAIRTIEPAVWPRLTGDEDEDRFVEFAQEQAVWQFVLAHAELGRIDAMVERATAFRKAHSDNEDARNVNETILAMAKLHKAHEAGDIERIGGCFTGAKPIAPEDEYAAEWAAKDVAGKLLASTADGHEWLLRLVKSQINADKTDADDAPDPYEIEEAQRAGALLLAERGDTRVDAIARQRLAAIADRVRNKEDAAYLANAWFMALLKLKTAEAREYVRAAAGDEDHPLKTVAAEAIEEFDQENAPRRFH